MKRILTAFTACLVAALGFTGCATPADHATLQRQVRDTEIAFARSMADRDASAFATFLADETMFFNRNGAVRGKAAVIADWKRFFAEPKAPFSWAPEQVEVLPSGTLAISSGPVFAPDGERAASFTSIWRLEAPGVWRIIFDKGCNCPP